MHLRAYRIKNYRRLRDVHIDLARDISIFVGANNSGKTSATQAIQMFLSGRKDQFSIFDFSAHVWKLLNELGNSDPANDANQHIPSITLDLWFEVAESDLYLVLPILPSSEWEGTDVGIRIEFGVRDTAEFLQRYRTIKRDSQKKAEGLGDSRGDYLPWPRTLAEFLEKEMHQQFELRYYVLDRSRFTNTYQALDGYSPAPMGNEPGGAVILHSLVRVDCLHAQRHLADPNSSTFGGAGRAEDLSKRLSRFYKRNLEQRPDDHSAIKALSDSEASLNKHLMEVFGPTLERIAKLGYPGLHNPRLEITSGLNPATVMSQDAKVNYVLSDGVPLRLPDRYNGLGFKNLIYMVVEILDAQEKWKLDEPRPPLHLIFIEEPEAHLHAQLQQVFIRNVLELLKIEGEDGSAFSSQVVITTHSPHILYERGFGPIRYFRRHVAEGEQTTQVLNLSTFQAGDGAKDRDFLQRYLKLTHCDLFFADAAILVEGNVERLLLPLMIEKESKTLRSAALSILEVGGAFGHRFRELILFLGITTLIITDLDSVTVVDPPTEEEEDQAEKEFEVPAEDGQKSVTDLDRSTSVNLSAESHEDQDEKQSDVSGEDAKKVVTKYGKTCEPMVGSVTANQTLIQWLPKKLTIGELFDVPPDGKIEAIPGTDHAKVRVAYQVPTDVTWGGSPPAKLCGRTLEISFGLENSDWCQNEERRPLGLKLRGEVPNPAALATGLHKRVSGNYFDKTKFALGVLARPEEEWVVPLYIAEGLKWLESVVGLETAQEVKSAEAAAEEVIEGADHAGAE